MTSHCTHCGKELMPMRCHAHFCSDVCVLKRLLKTKRTEKGEEFTAIYYDRISALHRLEDYFPKLLKVK